MANILSILGSTGSIGRQTLYVAERLRLRVAALTAGENVALLAAQCRKFQPKLAVMRTAAAAAELSAMLCDMNIQILSGEEGLLAAATIEEADTVVTAVVGMVGLLPTLCAIRSKKNIALANKETLVCAGELVMNEAARAGVTIVPVDSEHSAIFQCLVGNHRPEQVRRLILTCSGGPFFGMKRTELQTVTREDALRHPTWNMGEKITIDCATLMNKGLELIEAMRLYAVPPEKVEVLIHRTSIVHSLVEFSDGAVLAQLGVPDMRIPIQYALTYPDRADCPAEHLDLAACGALTFEKPDIEAFPCLSLAKEAARMGGTTCAAMNGANEMAVTLFLAGKIGFYEIAQAVQTAMAEDSFVAKPTLSQILAADQCARASVRTHFEK